MGPNFFFSAIGGHLHHQIDAFWFFWPTKRKFRWKILLQTYFGSFGGIMKNRFFPALRGQKGNKNVKKIENSKKMTMSAFYDLHHQNDNFEFSNVEKRKFRKKISLQTDVGPNWTILKKSIFFPQNLVGGGLVFFLWKWRYPPYCPL